MPRSVEPRRPSPLAALVALAALLIAAGAALAGSTRAATAQEPLLVATKVRYEVRPDEEKVHVTVDARATNQNPDSVRREVGTITFYFGYDLFVPAEAAAVRAFNARGDPLNIELSEVDEFFRRTTVLFDGRFFYGESYEFRLEYDLERVRVPDLVVSRGYTYFPAIADGTTSEVTILAPRDPSLTLSVDNPACVEQRGDDQQLVYLCEVSDPATFVAWVELLRPGNVGSLERSMGLEKKSVTLSIEYFEGDRFWAERLADLLEVALPVLEQVNGHPYQGPERVVFREAGRSETGGYAGRAQATCKEACVVEILPVSSTFVALHEAAHLWSGIFSERWLYEGFADWSAEQAALAMGLDVSVSTPTLASLPEQQLPLRQWSEQECPPIRCAESGATDSYGYAKSLAFLRLLEQRVGADALRTANLLISQRAEVADSRIYLDRLEEASGQSLDDLFAQWVFSPEDAPLLEQRRQARTQLAELEATLEGAWLELPGVIVSAVQTWDFERALELVPTALSVAEAYGRAETLVEEPRDLWQRVGLFGSDPEAQLAEAAAAYGEGRFGEALDAAEGAQQLILDAGQRGKERGALVAGLGAAVIVLGVILIWLVGRGRFRRPPYVY